MVEIKTEDFKYHPQIYVSVLSLEDSLLAENVRGGNNLKGPSRESPSTFWNFKILVQLKMLKSLNRALLNAEIE